MNLAKKSYSLLLLTILVVYVPAFVSARTMTCWIDSPCGWLDPMPGTMGKSLGFCVEKVEGRGEYLQVFRKNRIGQPLAPIYLKITELNANRLAAVSSDQFVTLNAGKYKNFWAGGLLFKSPTYKNGLGFQTACNFK